MANKSERDVVHRALRKASVIALEQEPDGNLYQDALEEYKAFHEWLREEFTRKVTWSFDSVPEKYWVYVAGWFAGRLVDGRPVAVETFQRVKAGALAAETSLREMLARTRLKTTEVDYF